MSSVRREPTVIVRLGAGLVVVCAWVLPLLPVVAAQSTSETPSSRSQARTFASPKEAIDYGDRCWSKVLSHWRKYLDEGLTQHRNWWPEVYQQACRNWGKQPDPKALAFAETYEGVRADLKSVTGSA